MSDKRKIIVIADDFTGAAEIGGIGLRHGLKVAVETIPIEKNGIDLLVIATDTRSMNKEDAAKHIEKVTAEALKLNPLFIYKKIDSLLRGNITAELSAQLNVMGLSRSIIVAGNPVFNRIIKNGKYFIDNVPLNETCFSNEYKRTIESNNVLDILKNDTHLQLHSNKPGDQLPQNGLIMGDVACLSDFNFWAEQLSENTLFAGASGFFNTLLSIQKNTRHDRKKEIKPFGEKVLFVLGSAYPKDLELLEKMIEQGHYHSNMPAEIYTNAKYQKEIFDNWYHEIIVAYSKYNKIIISSIHANSTEKGIGGRIKGIIAELVEKITESVEIDEILIEGGSTTSAVLSKLDVKRLTPIQELDTGVIRMVVDKIPHMCLTTKPGSYNWPENVWLQQEIQRFYNIKQNKVNINAND